MKKTTKDISTGIGKELNQACAKIIKKHCPDLPEMNSRSKSTGRTTGEQVCVIIAHKKNDKDAGMVAVIGKSSLAFKMTVLKAAHIAIIRDAEEGLN